MDINELSFVEYIGIEEQNLLTSMTNFRKEFDLFFNIDKVYQEPLRRLETPEKEVVILQLYLFVHFHLYFSVSCLLRSHLSECINSMRKAIDAALTTYKLILDPELTEKYLNRDNYFQYIKGNFQRELAKDSTKYPLAKTLINLHDSCSEFGSHADISSFFHRLEFKKLSSPNKQNIQLDYFQHPKNPEEYRFYFLVTLQAFFQMFLVFKIFFDRQLKIIDPKWEKTINILGSEIERLRKESHSKFNGKP